MGAKPSLLSLLASVSPFVPQGDRARWPPLCSQSLCCGLAASLFQELRPQGPNSVPSCSISLCTFPKVQKEAGGVELSRGCCLASSWACSVLPATRDRQGRAERAAKGGSIKACCGPSLLNCRHCSRKPSRWTESQATHGHQGPGLRTPLLLLLSPAAPAPVTARPSGLISSSGEHCGDWRLTSGPGPCLLWRVKVSEAPQMSSPCLRSAVTRHWHMAGTRHPCCLL